MTLETIDGCAENLIAGAVAELVVDRLEAVHVDVDKDEFSARSTYALGFALELVEPDPPSACPGQLVGPRLAALALSFAAIARGQLTFTTCLLAVALGCLAGASRDRAVARRPPTGRGCPGAQLRNRPHVMVEKLVIDVELVRLRLVRFGLSVALLSLRVSPFRHGVTLLSGFVAGVRTSLTRARPRLSNGGAVLVRRVPAAVLVIQIRCFLVSVRGSLVSVGGQLVGIGLRLVGVSQRLVGVVERLAGVRKRLVGVPQRLRIVRKSLFGAARTLARAVGISHVLLLPSSAASSLARPWRKLPISIGKERWRL